jgi:hypothetical protein
MVIDAREVIGSGFPPNEGERLADWVLKQSSELSEEQIDLTRCPPALIISAFFNAFLQRIYERNVKLYPVAKQLKWKLRFPFQERNVRDWIESFRPADAYPGKGSQ